MGTAGDILRANRDLFNIKTSEESIDLSKGELPSSYRKRKRRTEVVVEDKTPITDSTTGKVIGYEGQVVTYSGTDEQIRRQKEVRDLQRKGVDTSNIYFNREGQGVSMDSGVASQREYVANQPGIFYRDGQGYSISPDLVRTEKDVGFGMAKVETASGKSWIEQTGKTDVFGYSVASDAPIFTPPASYAYKTEDFLGRAKIVAREEKRILSTSPYSPLMYVGEGWRTFKGFASEGAVTYANYMRVGTNKPLLSTSEEKRLKYLTGGFADVTAVYTGSYVAGGLIGATSASYPGFGSLIKSPYFVYPVSAVYGVSLGYGYATSSDKGLFVAKSVAGLAGGVSGYRAGYSLYDPLNVQVSGKPKLSYNVREDIYRDYSRRLVDFNEDLVVSRRVGFKGVTRVQTPQDLRFTQRITSPRGAYGKRVIFDYGGVMDRYSVPRIFGGRQSVVREFTPISSGVKGVGAISYEAYAFGGRSGLKVYSLGEGVATYKLPTLRVSKIDTYGLTPLKSVPSTKNIYPVKAYTPESLERAKIFDYFNYPRQSIIDLSKTGVNYKVTGGRSRSGVSLKSYVRNVEEVSGVRRAPNLDLSRSVYRSYYTNDKSTRLIIGRDVYSQRVTDRFSYGESLSKVTKFYNSGSITYSQGVSQRISLGKPYVREIVRTPIFQAGKVSGPRYTTQVFGQRAIPVFGSKSYIDTLRVSPGGGVYELKYPQQLSETFIKNTITSSGSPIADISSSNLRIYPGTSYFKPESRTSEVFSKMLVSKKGSFTILRSRPVAVQIPGRIASVSRSGLNLNSFSNVAVPSSINIPKYELGIGYVPLSSPESSVDYRITPKIGQNYATRNNVDLFQERQPRIDTYREERIDTPSRIDTRVRSRVDSRLSQRQELLQLQETNIIEPQPSRVVSRAPRLTFPPWRPPVLDLTIPKIPAGSRSGGFKIPSFKLPKISTKESLRFDIVASLPEVFRYEAETGRESYKPKKTKRNKYIFEQQLFGTGSYTELIRLNRRI